MSRVKIWGKTPNGKIVEAHLENTLNGILFLNGPEGANTQVRLYKYVVIKNGEGKDAITIPYKERHNESTKEGVVTKSEDKNLQIPIKYKLEVKSMGKQQFIAHSTGKITKERVHSIVHGKNYANDVWDNLTATEQEHLSSIDIWDAYDELIKALNEEKTGFYVEALEQIYHKTLFKNEKSYIKVKPVFEQIPLNTLVGCDIMLTIQAGKYSETKHFTEGGIVKCKGEIKRLFLFTLPKLKIFTANLPGKYNVIRDIRRR